VRLRSAIADPGRAFRGTGKVKDQALLAQIATQAADAELRRCAISTLDSQAALADCAVNDMLAANRLAAPNACKIRRRWNRWRAASPSATSASID
jgi:hypothetical protein